MLYSASTGGFYDRSIHGAGAPPDAVEITSDQHASLLDGQSKGMRILHSADGGPVLADPEQPTLDQLVADITTAVQAHLDAAARAAGYDDIRSVVTYADEPAVPKFQADGQAFRAWRSLVWAKCYELLAAGKQLTAEAVIAQLPQL